MNKPTIVKKGKGVNLRYNGYRYSKDRKNAAGIQYWKCTIRSCSGRDHSIDTDCLQVLKATDHDHEPDYESTLSAKMKAGLCQKAADNPTLPMKELYNLSHKSSIISTWYAYLQSNFKRKMSELIAICIFLHVRRTSSRPDFFALKTAFKITKLKIYFKKKKQITFPTIF